MNNNDKPLSIKSVPRKDRPFYVGGEDISSSIDENSLHPGLDTKAIFEKIRRASKERLLPNAFSV